MTADALNILDETAAGRADRSEASGAGSLAEALGGLNPANSPAPTAPLRPFAHRPRSAQPGLRVLPLDGFHWGGTPRPGAPRTPRVRSDHCLIRVSSGKLRLILPGSRSDHGEGAGLFIPAGTAFATQPLDGAAGQVLLIPVDAAGVLGSRLPARMVVGADAGAAIIADLALLISREPGPAAKAEPTSASLQILAQPDQGAAARHDVGAAQLFAAFTELAGRELGRGRTVADLAAALDTTATTIEAACRRQRGCTALEVMYELRLVRARDMLARGQRSLPDIAEELGFTGIAHLNRAFMAATGRTAEAFRPRG